MEEYENKEFGVSFRLPERISVGKQLDFREAVFLSPGGIYQSYWAGAQTIIEDWQCDLIPDMAALDIDEVYDKRITNIVNWVANTVAGHMDALEDVAPNS